MPCSVLRGAQTQNDILDTFSLSDNLLGPNTVASPQIVHGPRMHIINSQPSANVCKLWQLPSYYCLQVDPSALATSLSRCKAPTSVAHPTCVFTQLHVHGVKQAPAAMQLISHHPRSRHDSWPCTPEHLQTLPAALQSRC